MNNGSWSGPHLFWTCPVLLVLLLAQHQGAKGAEAAKPEDYLLGHADAFLTIRPARLADKLGIKHPTADFPWLDDWKAAFGLPLTNVDRCTLVLLPEDRLWIIRSDKPYNQKSVLSACGADLEEKRHSGKICHVSSSSGAAILLVDARTFLRAEKEETLVGCLKQESTSGKSSFRVGNHDIEAWSRATPLHRNPAPVVSRACAERSNGKHVAAKVEPEQASTLSVFRLPLPLPPGVESATLTLDCGDSLVVEMNLKCRNRTAARKAGKGLRALLDLSRGTLLLATAELDLAKLLPEVAKDFTPIPTTLLHKTEKSLQRVRICSEGVNVPFSVRIPMDAKAIRSELAAWSKVMKSSSTRGWAIGLPTGCSATPPDSPLPVPSQGDAVLPPSMPPPPDPPPPPTPPATSVKLTVANVAKETALLFTMSDGKLTFQMKVPAGEAVDLDTTMHQRWMAVFAEKPAGETFVPTEAKAIWLLRPAAFQP